MSPKRLYFHDPEIDCPKHLKTFCDEESFRTSCLTIPDGGEADSDYKGHSLIGKISFWGSPELIVESLFRKKPFWVILSSTLLDPGQAGSDHKGLL